MADDVALMAEVPDATDAARSTLNQGLGGATDRLLKTPRHREEIRDTHFLRCPLLTMLLVMRRSWPAHLVSGTVVRLAIGAGRCG